MPHTTWHHRARGAALALLVQASFLLLLLFSSQHPLPSRIIEHETILLLPPMAKITPRTIDARAPQTRSVTPVQIPILPNAVPPVPQGLPVPPVLSLPSGIAGFGRSLFGCAPERYADLPPDEKAHCPKPGEGLAVNPPPDLLNPPRSHAKYEARWQEELAERKWTTACTGEADVAKCMMHQAMAESRRAEIAQQRIADSEAAALAEPKRPMPRIGKRQN